MAPKRRAKEEVSSEDAEDLVSEEEEKPKKARKPAAKKPTTAAAASGPHEDDQGYTIIPPSLIVRTFGEPKPNTKIAAFDLDGTLVNTKSNAQFPRGPDDWRFYNKKTAKEVKALHEQGYKLVIFSNQNSIKGALEGKAAANVKGRVANVVKELGIPMQVLMATQKDDNRKPAVGMWSYFCEHMNGGMVPDKSSCLFVGDAAGRPLDFADSDRKFAEAVGISFKVPEDVFGEMEGKRMLPPAGDRGEAVASPAAAGGDASAPASTAVNAELVEVFKKVAEAHFKADKKFQGIAANKAAKSLEVFPVKVTLANLKEAGKLPGIGKGSIAMMQEYLSTGKLAVLDGESAESGAGGDELKGGAKPNASKPDASKAMALNFM